MLPWILLYFIWTIPCILPLILSVFLPGLLLYLTLDCPCILPCTNTVSSWTLLYYLLYCPSGHLLYPRLFCIFTWIVMSLPLSALYPCIPRPPYWEYDEGVSRAVVAGSSLPFRTVRSAIYISRICRATLHLPPS